MKYFFLGNLPTKGKNNGLLYEFFQIFPNNSGWLLPKITVEKHNSRSDKIQVNFILFFAHVLDSHNCFYNHFKIGFIFSNCNSKQNFIHDGLFQRTNCHKTWKINFICFSHVGPLIFVKQHKINTWYARKGIFDSFSLLCFATSVSSTY